MENQLGGGLIEEVIQVAEGELKLVGVMAKAKVYVLPVLLLCLRSHGLTLLQMGRARR